MTSSLDTLPPAYVPRDPSQTVLYQVIADHLETFLASLDTDPDARLTGVCAARIVRLPAVWHSRAWHSPTGL